MIAPRSFVILTTSIVACSLAKGLLESGHTILAVGRGYTRNTKIIGSVSSTDIRQILGPSLHVVDLDIERETEIEDFLKSSGADFAVISWPRILSRSVIESTGTRFIGTHPTPLPLGRGRHPLHWMRVLGIRNSQLTAFWLNESVDDGPIIARAAFRTHRRGDINSDNESLVRCARKIGRRLGFRLLFPAPKGQFQDAAAGTLLRARNQEDSIIDFRMSSRAIYDHVASVKHPWDGCRVLTDKGQLIEVLDAKRPGCMVLRPRFRWSPFGAKLQTSVGKANTVWTLVRCYGGSIWIETEREI